MQLRKKMYTRHAPTTPTHHSVTYVSSILQSRFSQPSSPVDRASFRKVFMFLESVCKKRVIFHFGFLHICLSEHFVSKPRLVKWSKSTDINQKNPLVLAMQEENELLEGGKHPFWSTRKLWNDDYAVVCYNELLFDHKNRTTEKLGWCLGESIFRYSFGILFLGSYIHGCWISPVFGHCSLKFAKM